MIMASGTKPPRHIRWIRAKFQPRQDFKPLPEEYPILEDPVEFAVFSCRRRLDQLEPHQRLDVLGELLLAYLTAKD